MDSGNTKLNRASACPPLAGRTILLTGASGGLGTCVARTLWRCGASLLVVGRNSDRLARIAEALEADAAGDQEVHPIVADLSRHGAAESVVEQARGCCRRLYALINNAAELGPIGPFSDNDRLLWNRAIQVDLLAPVALCHAAIPWLKECGGGRIVNISGGGATSPRPNFSAYATAKAALVRFSETLAQEVAAHHIQVNCVAPGAMDTDFVDAVLEAEPELAGEERARALETRRSGGARPQNAAELIAFLLSADSDGITGKLISAVWDPWRNFTSRIAELRTTDVYTIRRITPSDRGLQFE